MPQLPEEPETQPAWVQPLGCLIGLFGFTLVFLFLLASCTANPEANGSVIVDDKANILAPWAEVAIKEIKFPQDTPVVVRTVSSIPPAKIGTFATDLMLEEPHWQTLRPRGWLREYIRQDSPSGPGVYVLVSLEPQLLQIRFGRDIRLDAYQHMLAVGTWYLAQQRFERDALDQHVLETVKELAQKMQKLTNPSWPLSWAQSLSSLVISEIEDFASPSDGLYSDAALKNYIILANNIGATGSAWGFIVFNVAVFVLLWLFGKKLLIDWILLPRIKWTWFQTTLVILSELGLLGVLVTGYASLAALSKGRVEDELALEILGLSSFSTSGIDATLFTIQGGLWLAIPGAIISFLGDAIHSAQIPDDDTTSFPVMWIAWGCALFIMPKAIAITALTMLIWNTGSDIVKVIPTETTALEKQD